MSFSDKVRVVWSGEALGQSARVVVDISGAVVQSLSAWPSSGSGPVWGPAEAVHGRAALAEAVVSLSERGALACYLLLEEQASREERVAQEDLRDVSPADVIREFMDGVWFKLLTEGDRAWLNARGHVSAGAKPVDGGEKR